MDLLPDGGTGYPRRGGVFHFADNAQHIARRKLFNKSFSMGNLRENWEDFVREKTKYAVERIVESGTGGRTVNMLEWWMFYASDVSATLMFGESFHSLEMGKVSTVLPSYLNVPMHE